MNLMNNKPDTIEERLGVINLYFDKIEDKKSKIEDLTFEKDLIEKDLIEQVKNLECAYEVRFTAFKPGRFALAFNHDKEALEEITKLMNYAFFDDDSDVEFIKIIMFGYAWAYDFYYKYKDKVFVIRVPMFNTACKENIYYLLQGYTLYEQVSENIQNEIAESFNINIIKDAIKNWRKNND